VVVVAECDVDCMSEENNLATITNHHIVKPLVSVNFEPHDRVYGAGILKPALGVQSSCRSTKPIMEYLIE
jgi:hypothetical protein